MEEQRNSKKNDLIPAASTKMNSCLSDRDRSSIKSASVAKLDLEWIAEARKNRFFAQLWDGDGLFKPYATSAFTLANISCRSTAERADFYRQIATKSRTELLTDLSGIEVRPGTLRLLSKTDYKLFEEDDWRALLSVCMDPIWRRELHRLERISRILVHQNRRAGSGSDLLSRNSRRSHRTCGINGALGAIFSIVGRGVNEYPPGSHPESTPGESVLSVHSGDYFLPSVNRMQLEAVCAFLSLSPPRRCLSSWKPQSK